MFWHSTWNSTQLFGVEPAPAVSDWLGVLLALGVIIVPLVLAWFLTGRRVDPRGPSQGRERRE
jgi:hypothetical protein